MADLTIKQITFMEGEPLDPKKLNDLQQNINSIFKQNVSLQNATVGSKTVKRVPIIDANTLPVGNLEAGKAKTVALNWLAGAIFDLTGNAPAPYVTATISKGTVPKDGHVTITSNISSTSSTLTILSNKAISDVEIDWIAIQFKNLV